MYSAMKRAYLIKPSKRVFGFKKSSISAREHQQVIDSPPPFPCRQFLLYRQSKQELTIETTQEAGK